GTADRNRSHWSTSKTPSYTKSVSWQHHPPMDACIASADNKTIARQMNKTVEILVGPHPEQYVWVLKLLKTRKSNEADPYP
ncbi:hypothetical protein ODS95_23500, partial [Escherichia coli]|nr:hypothetical protein [Escherichia coli]MDZ8289632.1 hypothetical protein [Escherichia coli]MDZ8529259.1 hypothetical protein [Escherichia coli]MDZ8944466.1 hypothetical protein [Escherichia coli]MDZ9021899.1 hypothetical protein [Escherichia coli]